MAITCCPECSTLYETTRENADSPDRRERLCPSCFALQEAAHETRDALVGAYLTVRRKLRSLRERAEKAEVNGAGFLVAMGERELAGFFLHLFRGSELEAFDLFDRVLGGRYSKSYPNVRGLLEGMAGRPECSRLA